MDFFGGEGGAEEEEGERDQIDTIRGMKRSLLLLGQQLQTKEFYCYKYSSYILYAGFPWVGPLGFCHGLLKIAI